MDLVAGVKKIVVIMEHSTKKGDAKILKECTLPLTGTQVVDMIVTELGVFRIENKKLYLDELAPGVSVEEITQRTEAPFEVIGKAAA